MRSSRRRRGYRILWAWATVLAVGLWTAALAADPNKHNDANDGIRIQSRGILTAQDKDSLTLLTEGEDAPAKYVFADGFDKKQLMITWPISPLQMTYVKGGGVRRLLSIKGEPRADKGTVTGSVVFIGPNAFWIAVKPTDGPVDAYACSWPPGDISNKLKTLHKGDTVAIRFHADGQRYRIDSLAMGSEAPEMPAAVLPAGVEAVFDVEYAKVAGKSLRLDVYRPKDAKGPLPLVVWIHGGAWLAGSKEDCRRALGLVPHGYIVASINYRLSFEAIFPAQIHDCKGAIRFLRANARKYSIDPDHVGVWGSSAGSHLAALVGTSGGVKLLEGNVGGNLDVSSRVQCVVEYFGPTDLLAFRGQKATVALDTPNSFLVRFVGGTVDEKNPLVAQANPITYVSKDTPPFFVAHGDKDDTVPLNQSELLVEAIRKAGGTAVFEVVKGTGHDFAPDSQRQYERLEPMVIAFFDRHLKNLPVAHALAGAAETPVAAPPVAGKGVAVVLGRSADGGSSALADLAERDRWTVLFQSPDAREAATVREWAEERGLLGERVFVAQSGYGRIVLADNLATAAWVQASAAGKVAEAELLRVLHPGGTAHLDGKAVTKPVPEGADVWSHPFHGPDNNPLSIDRLARAPYLTQFIAEPKFSPLPTVVVAAGGRVFRAHGHISFQANQTPVINTLVCSNGYSGTVLWTRPLKEGFMIHRMCMAATDDALYLADDESCKVLDAATGKVAREIVVPDGVAEGKVWKWMVLTGGKLYALVGGPETQPKPIRATGLQIGHWPWSMWDGFDYREPKTSYGFGRTFLAMDPADGKVLWRHAEQDYVDGRGICMGNDRIYYYCPQKFLACLDACTGEAAWKNTDSDLLKAIGPTGRAQNPMQGFSTTCFLKCDSQRLYFAGPQRSNVVVASAADGKLLWQRPDGNFHLIMRPEALYGIGAAPGFKADYATGKVLAQYPGRRSCTRATSSADAIFYRAPEGTVRIDLASGTAQHMATMRPPCLEGVIVAHGMLYWGPWMCGCPLSFYGHVAVTGAGGFDAHPGMDASRLGAGEGDTAKVEELTIGEGDTTAWSADPHQNGSKIAAPRQVAQAWEVKLAAGCRPAGAAAAGGLAFVADRTGAVRALDAATGAPKWKAYADGAVYYPPAVWNGRLYVGAADGKVYAFEAATGRRLWAFRLAPADRWIPVFGHLTSTWPVAGGVIARDGAVYAAAGMADYDGTHVAALDAVTGKPLWYNDSTGRMSETVRSGISLQGELTLRDGKLCFAGGGIYGTAMFDAKTGKCLNDPVNSLGSRNPTAFYAHYPEYGQYTALDYTLPDGRTLSYEPLYDGSRHAPLALLKPVPAGQKPPPPGWRLAWRRPGDNPKPAREAVWTDPSRRQFNAFVVAPGVLLAAGQGAPGSGARPFVAAISIEDGSETWRHELPAPPVKGGLAVDRGGRIFAALADGRVLCLAERR